MTTIWVSTRGSDITGTGTQVNPYLTIEMAMTVFVSGDQIRIVDGTYAPVDSLVFSGVDGSIFADNPGEVTIIPAQTTLSSAVIDVQTSTRFEIHGLNIKQATDPTGNNYGIYVDGVTNLVINRCTVDTFTCTGATVAGIYAGQSYGRITECTVTDFISSGTYLYGISAERVDVCGCTVQRLTGDASTTVEGIASGTPWYRDMLANWKLNGSLGDSSGNGLDMNPYEQYYHGFWDPRIDWTPTSGPGHSGLAVRFPWSGVPGFTAYIHWGELLGSTTGWIFDEFTVTFWTKNPPIGGGTDTIVLAKGNDVATNYSWYISDSSIRVDYAAPLGNDTLGAPGHGAGPWYFLAYSFKKGSRLQAYCDGNYTQLAVGNFAIRQCGLNVTMGGFPGSELSLHQTYLDDVRFYIKELTQAQMDWLWLNT